MLTKSAVAVLDRARIGERFSEEDARQVSEIAKSSVPVIIAEDSDFREMLGGLDSVMPSAATDEVRGGVKWKIYKAMLSGCDKRALAYACRRAIDELQWFPTIKQLKDFMAEFVSEEARLIGRAQFVVREAAYQAAQREPKPMTADDLAAMARTEIGRIGLQSGLASGTITQEQFDAAMEGVEA